MGALVFLFIILNFGISWLNAWSVGRSWADSKAVGGWPRFLVWCAAIMSASGFTWCYTVILAMIAGAAGWLSMPYVDVMLKLGYVVIIFPMLGTGLAITLDSVTTAWRRRDAVSIGTAAWNVFAQAHNTYEAASMLPGIFKDLGKAFDSDDSDDAKGPVLLLVVLLVAFALAGGILTTIGIVRVTARKYALSVAADMASRGNAA